jgi:sec-independent protein translocase protein TatC
MPPHPHPDDLFADTRMSFGDHLEELRRCLWRGLAGFALIVVLVFVCDFIGYLTGTRFGVGRPVLALIAAPVEASLQELYDRRAQRLLEQMRRAEAEGPTDRSRDVPVAVDLGELADHLAPILALPRPTAAPAGERVIVLRGRLSDRTWTEMWLDAEKRLGRRPTVQTFGVAEALTVYLKVALLCGVVLGSPWLFFQAWQFVAAGLYPAERRWVRVYLPLSLPLIFGVSFQLPLAMLVAERVGLVSARTYQARWGWALFLVHLFAAAVMPTPDWLSMEALAVPLLGLYGLGILLCRLTPHAAAGPEVEGGQLVEG